MSERRACRLVELDRSSYRDEPRADHNAQLREELVKLARQKPRYPSLSALRRRNSRRSTSPASTALAGTGGARRTFYRFAGSVRGKSPKATWIRAIIDLSKNIWLHI
jgi:hypothetical protein